MLNHLLGTQKFKHLKHIQQSSLARQIGCCRLMLSVSFGHFAGIGDRFSNDRFRTNSHKSTLEERSHHRLSATQTRQFQTTNPTCFHALLCGHVRRVVGLPPVPEIVPEAADLGASAGVPDRRRRELDWSRRQRLRLFQTHKRKGGKGGERGSPHSPPFPPSLQRIAENVRRASSGHFRIIEPVYCGELYVTRQALLPSASPRSKR